VVVLDNASQVSDIKFRSFHVHATVSTLHPIKFTRKLGRVECNSVTSEYSRNRWIVGRCQELRKGLRVVLVTGKVCCLF